MVNGVMNGDSSIIEQKKFGDLWSTNKKVIGTHVDLPYVNIGYSAYAAAFEFGPHDFATGGISPHDFFPPNRTYGARRTHVGLCPKFLVDFCVSSL